MQKKSNMDFESERFERKLVNLKDTQDSITGLSKWCLNKRAAHKQIVKSWLKTLKEVKVEHRLTLFYLANDVIQHSKRKNYEFVESWGTSLQRATTLVRDEKVREKISRIFKIWQQREIYSEDVITDLHGLLFINALKKPHTPPTLSQSSTGSSPINAARSDDDEDEFQLTGVVTCIRNCVSLESETDKNLKLVVKSSIPEIEKIQNNLKDRSQVVDIQKEIQQAMKHHEEFITSLNAEIRARKLLLTALEQADKFYRNQRRDVKKVVYAYKNFGDRIKLIQTEINTKASGLPSPIPSPDINAPSPEPDNDFELPTEMNFYNSNGTFGSFLNDGPLPFDLNEFYRESPPPLDHQIPVLQSQDHHVTGAPITDFYNPLMPPNPAMNYVDPYRPSQNPPLPNISVPQQNATSSFICTAPPPPPSSQPPLDFFPPLPANVSMNSSNNDDYSSSWNDWNIDTPISPPHYERKSIGGETIEYIDESLREIDSSLSDIDHRQLFGADLESKDIDHRNLISLTGSPGSALGNGKNNESLNGNDNFRQMPPQPLLDVPMSHQFNNFMGRDLGMQSGFSRNSRPPLLPTPSMPPQMKYGRNLSMMSDSTQSLDDNDTAAEVDMELSDDDGMDCKNSIGDHRDFHNSQASQFSQLNLHRPPPPLPHDNDMNQRKSWIHNNQGMDSNEANLLEPPPSQNFMSPPPNHRNKNFQGNFRGQNRRGNMNNGNSMRGGTRGNFRGNYRGGQW